jgi:tRNA dimethylallyltransferase
MMGNGHFPVVIVAGPTCSGKSALALDIAERFDGVVINADSMQVYRELQILTARPGPAEEARAPHRLYGVISGTEACSAARWREMALEEIVAARQAGYLPVLCGGTGLYIKALTEGLSPVPETPDTLRQALRRRSQGVDSVALHSMLEAVDPETAARVPAGDRQRILRALEVLEATGRSLTSWQREPLEPPPDDLTFHTILLLPPREILYAAIDARFQTMIEAGALEEVRQLRALGLDSALPAMRALGVPELRAYLDGAENLEDAVSAAQQATRNYAKRQITWFRHQIVAQKVEYEQYSERLRGKIFSFICKNVLTRSR